MLSRVFWGGVGAKTKATSTLGILARSAADTGHVDDHCESGGQVLCMPLYVSGVVVMGD